MAVVKLVGHGVGRDLKRVIPSLSGPYGRISVATSDPVREGAGQVSTSKSISQGLSVSWLRG